MQSHASYRKTCADRLDMVLCRWEWERLCADRLDAPGPVYLSLQTIDEANVHNDQKRTKVSQKRVAEDGWPAVRRRGNGRRADEENKRRT